MPSGVVPQSPPQLPPLPPQPSLATPSNWKLHYPPEDITIPVAGDSSLPRSGHEQSSSGSNLRSHSQNGSRVPLPILPSASSSESIVISQPTKTHSRSISIHSIRHPPTSRPNRAGKDTNGGSRRPSTGDKDSLRQVSKHARPALPLRIPDQLPAREQPPLKDTLASVDKVFPTQANSMSPASPDAAPFVRPRLMRQNSSPRPTPITDVPIGTPIAYHGSERERENEGGLQKDKAGARPHQEFAMPSPDQSLTDARRPPTPPKARSKGLPASPAPKSRTEAAPAIRIRTTSDHTLKPRRQGAPSTRSPISPASTNEATRSPIVGHAARPSGKVNNNSTSPAPSSTTLANMTGYARKWVLEKNGRRLTQDTAEVAQQLRMLR